MPLFFQAVIGVFFISLVSLSGAAVLILRKRFLEKSLIFLVAFSAGGLLGGALFHLLPEGLAITERPENVFVFLAVGFCFFFALEKILHWHHCHRENCAEHRHLGWMNLLGDAVHNFIDGLVIMAAFQSGTALGLAVTLSVFLHEIPQELSDFGVLIYAGFGRFKALWFNLFSGLVSLLGVISAYFLLGSSAVAESFLLPFAAGGFIYIAAADLVPEIHKETGALKSFLTFAVFVLAVALMFGFKIWFR